MKKKLNLLYRIAAALLAVLMFASCGLSGKTTTTEAEETEDPNVGRYYLGAVEVRGEGLELSESDAENNFIRLKDDGKLTMQISEQKYDGSWKVKKDVLTVKMDGDNFKEDEYEGSIEDGVIDITIDEIHMILLKGKSAAKEYMKAHPATKAETTEAPTEPSTEKPAETTTAADVKYSIYYALYWNGWYPEKDKIQSNYIAFPTDGSDAILLIEDKMSTVPWRFSGGELDLTIEGKRYETIFEEPRIKIDTDELKALFVFGSNIAAQDWEKLYGGEPAGTEAPTGPAESTEEQGGKTGEGFSIKEQVVLERDGIRVTAVKTVNDQYYGRGFEFKVENSTEKDLYVASCTASVNGAMLADDFYCRVEPGKTETEVMFLGEDLLKAYSIDKIGYLTFTLRAVDRGDYSTYIGETDPIVIKTGDYGKEDAPKIPKDAVKIHEGKGIRIYYVNTDFDDYGYLYSRLYVVNNSGRRIYIEEDKVLLNGTDADGFIYDDVADDGCVLVCDLEYEKDSLKTIGIAKLADLTSLGLSFQIYDEDTFDEIDVTAQWDKQF